jgi:hypothetical protein
MKYSELVNLLANSKKDDWIINDDKGEYTNKNDLNLRISRTERNFELDKFEGEEWANKHPDPNAYKVKFEVYYGASLIEERMLVSVDGGRAMLPLPDRETLKVHKEDYQFAQIVEDTKDLDNYMKRSGLTIENT